MMVDLFLNVVNWIDVVTKVIAWIVVFVAAILLFGKQIKVSFSINSFFKKAGINLFQSMVIPFISRDNCTTNTRKFMEYTILHNLTGYLTHNEWKKIILDFKADYIEKKDVDEIEIGNTFILKNEIIRASIKEYFNFIKNYKELFSIAEDSKNRLLLKIKIKYAFLTPLIQISSLQDRYNQDWSKVLDRYASEFVNIKNKKMPTEVSTFYTWLMWGPSACIIPNDNDSKLCLLGLGDESMAIPIVIPSNIKTKVWDDIKKDVNNNVFGTFVSGTYYLYDKDTYLEKMRSTFDDATLTFVNAEIESEEKGLLLVANNDLEKMTSASYAKTMFTAYIWIMLYYTDGAIYRTFDCMNSTVFFEHANISDSENVKILTKTLINKCITYLRTIYSNKEYYNRIYYVPWAINEEIKNLFREEIMKCDDLNDKVKFDNPIITYDSILASIDNEFRDSELTVKYLDVNFDNYKDLGILGKFYCELYIKGFPDENERETLENIISQAKRISKIKECEYHCIIALQGDDIVGGIIGDYLSECNSGVIEFVVVDPEKRKLHIASGLISHLFNSFNKDANRYNEKIRTIDYCFFECENPEKVDVSIKEQCIKRLGFWNKKVAYRLDIDYVQIPLEEGKEAVDWLFFCAMVVNKEISNLSSIPKDIVMKAIESYFKYAFDTDDITNKKELLKMKENNKNKNEISLLRLL